VALKRGFGFLFNLISYNAAIATTFCFHNKAPNVEVNDWRLKKKHPEKPPYLIFYRWLAEKYFRLLLSYPRAK
jgi:hypothetical protein